MADLKPIPTLGDGCQFSAKACARIGAASAAFALLAALAAHATVNILVCRPEFLDHVPIFLVLCIPWVVGAAVPGAIIGMLASKVSRVALGGVLGTAIATPLGVVVALLSSYPQWPEPGTLTLYLILAMEAGAAAGSFSSWSVLSRSPPVRRQGKWRVPAAILAVLSAPMAVWCAWMAWVKFC